MNIKGKNKTIFLLLIVLLLYGAIGIKIKDSVDIENKMRSDSNIHKELNNIVKIDSYSFDLKYRNPFKKRSRKQYLNSNNKVNSNYSPHKANVRRKNKTKENKTWPSIKVKAIISGSENKLCIIEIDNKEIVFRETEEDGGVKLINIFHDSINICFNEEYKIFKL